MEGRWPQAASFCRPVAGQPAVPDLVPEGMVVPVQPVRKNPLLVTGRGQRQGWYASPATPSQRTSHILCWSACDWRVLMAIPAWGRGLLVCSPLPLVGLLIACQKTLATTLAGSTGTPTSPRASMPPLLTQLKTSVIKSQNLDNLMGGPPEIFSYTRIKRLLTQW